MKERPILFGPAMVRAILNGRKTQTRRIVKPPFELHANGYLTRPGKTERLQPYPCPYGQVGERLWIRERFRLWEPDNCICAGPFCGCPSPGTPIYFADTGDDEGAFQWKPSIHMNKEFSRLTLELTGIRIQYLQDISTKDAISEGLEPTLVGVYDNRWKNGGYGPRQIYADPRWAFKWLWNGINQKRGYEWESNPLVWVVDFKVMEMEG
ncbi:hypothetical protein [Desulfoluna spongiiphila]|uniref:Morphogenetic protein n=1 Tax=Desulfoluna spongiiphila TaxID=419481 RepID=A0A1G5G1P5_9BACT|nr:hypothetical protein [Desulfoluna spongiiphila]SCY45289.1 hypothetical protein SAMN05216233_109141 [Desulfoluna spongiiphila]